MVIVIISVLSVFASTFISNAYQSFTVGQELSEIENQGALALNKLTNDIQNTRSPADMTTINSNALSFTDVNGNSISYTVSGSNLLRSGLTLVDNLSSLSFGYLDLNGNATAIAASVVYVTVSLTLAKGSITETFATTISTRFQE